MFQMHLFSLAQMIDMYFYSPKRQCERQKDVLLPIYHVLESGMVDMIDIGYEDTI